VEPAKLTEFLDKHEIRHEEFKENEWDIPCPWEELHNSSTHRDTAVAIIRGLPTFHCYHNSCDGKTFKHFRNFYDPKHNFRFSESDETDWEWADVGTDHDPEDVPEEETGPEPETVRAEVPTTAVGADMPMDCMYGVLKDMALRAECPLGYIYPALLAVSAGLGIVDIDDNVRGTLYVVLVGNVGSGKTVAMKRAQDSIFLAQLSARRDTPGSDRGLLKILDSTDGFSILLVQDEFRNTMTKANFSGSSLAPVMCDLWSEDEAGAGDKKGVDHCNCKLSILGNLACEDATDFSTIFGAQTSKGLADRTVLGFTTESFEWQPIKLKKEVFEPKPCRVPGHLFQRKKEWVAGALSRRRLGEIALRIALITSAMHGESEVSDLSMECALRFCEWQERLRENFRPGMSENLEGKCTEAILAIVGKLTTNKAAIWSNVAKKYNWYRKFGASLCIRIRTALVLGGEIEFDKESGKIWKP